MPHVFNEFIPRLPLPGPRGAVAFPGLCFDDIHKAVVILRHPAIDIVEEGRVAPDLIGTGEPRCKRFAHPGNAGAAAAIVLADGGRPVFRLQVLVRPPTGCPEAAVLADVAGI